MTKKETMSKPKLSAAQKKVLKRMREGEVIDFDFDWDTSKPSNFKIGDTPTTFKTISFLSTRGYIVFKGGTHTLTPLGRQIEI